MKVFKRFLPPLAGKQLVAFRLLALLAGASTAYLLPKVLRHDGLDGLDFRLIWLAGRMWLAGADPYSATFISNYRDVFGEGPVTHFWVYPPNWYALAAPFGLLSFRTAVVVWKIVGFGTLLWSSVLLGRVADPRSGARFWVIALSVLSATCLMQGTAVTISIGQTSILLYFGMCLVIYGLSLKPSMSSLSPALVAGLVITLLKPQVGITFIAGLLALGHWRSVAVAGTLGAIVALPVFLATGWLETLKGFAGNVARYSGPGMSANAPPDLTGVIHLVDLLSRQALPAVGLALVAAVLAILVCYVSPRGRAGESPESVWRVLLCSVFALLLVPLHSYDLIPLAGLGILLVMQQSHPARWLVAAGLLLALRADNLAMLTGIQHPRTTVFHGSLLESIALTLVVIACFWMAHEHVFSGPPASE